MKNGAVDVTNVVDAIDGFGSEGVGGPNGVSGFGASACEPYRHRFRVVVAPVVGTTITGAVIRGAPKFPAPNDEGFIEDTALFEIVEKSCDGFVDGANE